MHLAEDSWLVEHLGVPVWSVRGFDDSAEPKLPAGPAFVQARVPADRVDVVERLARLGFLPVSVSITLERAPDADALIPPGAPLVRDADPARDGELAALAGRAFHASRFHTDPRVDPSVAARIKEAWVESYLGGARGARLFVAGDCVGFLAVLAADAVWTIELIGVDPGHQSSGVGAALVAHFLREAAAAGVGLVRVGTQAANPGATRFYERAGFVVVSAAFDMHLHVT